MTDSSVDSNNPKTPETPSPGQLIDSLTDGVYYVDQRRLITYWNKGAERVSGYAAEEVTGTFCGAGPLQHTEETGRCLCGDQCPLKETIRDGNSRTVEVYLQHKLGYRVPVLVQATAIRDDQGEIVGAVEVFRDASAQKLLERRAAQLERFAYQDGLTGVGNRRYVAWKVRQMVEDVRAFGRHVGLILLDLDHFKQINDTQGHGEGDRVLLSISKTLIRTFRPKDIIGRWGGEEFLVLLLDPKFDAFEKIAERCRAEIAATRIHSSGHTTQVTASIGATRIFPGDSAHSVIARADTLMYRSKHSGRNRVTVADAF